MQAIDFYPYFEVNNSSCKQINRIVSLADKYNLADREVYISFSTTSLKYLLDSRSSAFMGYLISKPIN